MISIELSLVYFLLLFSCSFFIGRAILGSPRVDTSNSIIYRAGVYFLTGLPILILLLFTIGLFTFSKWIFIIFIVGIHLIAFFIRPRDYLVISRVRFLKVPSNRTVWEVIPAVILISIFGFTIYNVYHYQWPPAGDAQVHGLITSLSVFNDNLPWNYGPLSPDSIDTPLGFHSVSAFFVALLEIYPGESVFLLAAFLVGAIAVVIFALTYKMTNSIVLATIASLFVLVVNPTGNLETWLMGYFYNGPYPNIAGFLLVLVSILLYVISQDKPVLYRHIWAINLTVIASLLVTYTLFALVSIAFLTVMYAVNSSTKLRHVNLQKISRRHKVAIVTIIALPLAIIVIIFSSDISNSVLETAAKVYARPSYSLSIDYFRSNLFGMLSIAAAISAITLLVFRRDTQFSLIYLTVFGLVFFSVYLVYFSIILPKRSAVLLATLSWVFLFFAASELSKVRILSNLANIRKSILQNAAKLIPVMVLFVLIPLPSIQAHINNEIMHRYDWFSASDYFRADYPLLEWIHSNIPSNALILNDYSYTSQYLLSFSIKNITSHYWLGEDKAYIRAMDAKKYWQDPTDLCFLRNIVVKHDIKYILTTQEWGFHDWLGLGGDDQYKAKPYDRLYLQSVLSSTALVKPVFQTFNGGLYEISQDHIDDILVIRPAFSYKGQDYWKDVSKIDNQLTTVSNVTVIRTDSTLTLELIHDMESQDWRDVAYVDIPWYGRDTGRPLQFSIFGPTGNDLYFYQVTDNFNGWKNIRIPIDSITIKYNSPDLSSIIRIGVTALDVPADEYRIGEISLYSCRGDNSDG